MIGKVKLFGDSPLDPPRGSWIFLRFLRLEAFSDLTFSSLRYQTPFTFRGKGWGRGLSCLSAFVTSCQIKCCKHFIFAAFRQKNFVPLSLRAFVSKKCCKHFIFVNLNHNETGIELCSIFDLSTFFLQLYTQAYAHLLFV